MNENDKFLLNYSNGININNTEEVVQNLQLTKVEKEVNGGITGRVVNNTGAAISGVTVKVFDLNYNPIKHTMTNETGTYNITLLQPGTYLVYAVKDGYSISEKITTTISEVSVSLSNIILTENNIYTKGTVYGITYNKNKIKLSKIKLTLSTLNDPSVVISETYSATDGEYVFYNLTSGTYKLNALSDDYILTEPINVIVADGVNNNEILYLDKLSTAKEGTINGIITDSETSVPIEGAFVGLYRVDEEEENKESLLNVTTTNREGKYFFGYVPDGKYVVKAKSTK